MPVILYLIIFLIFEAGVVLGMGVTLLMLKGVL